MIIYLITNLVNGKLYVGQTIRSIEERWKNHTDDIVVDRAIKKYGVKNFKIEQILSCSSQKELDFWENFLIKLLDTKNPNIGYNIKDGGASGAHSEETKKLISESSRLMWKDPNKKAEISRSISKKLKEVHPKGMLGKSHRDNTKQLMSRRRKEFYKNPETEKTRGAVAEKARNQIYKQIEILGCGIRKGLHNKHPMSEETRDLIRVRVSNSKWITNEIESKRIASHQEIPVGWRSGRKRHESN